MTYATYTLGPPTRPSIQHDNGFLDSHAMRAPTDADRQKYSNWRWKLEGGEAVQGLPFAPHLPDALAAYRHFMDGTGKERRFSYERYVSDDASGRTTLKSAIVESMNAAYDLSQRLYGTRLVANFTFTGSAISCGARSPSFPYPATENWQKAIGAHVIWLSGSVHADRLNRETPFEYEMKLTLHAEDRYNFNPGNKDIKTGIADAENGLFEITGLAKQYMNVATLERTVEWIGSPGKTYDVSWGPFLRQRQPADNRRLRNRI